MDAERPLAEAHYRELAPFSKRLLAATVNGRSAPGKFVAAYKRELLGHLGRPPSTVEMRIVERAALLAAHLMLLDRKAFREGGLSPRTMREYLSLNNALVRTLALLRPADGGDGESKPKTLADIATDAKPEPDLAGYLQRRAANGETSP
jgi:hypothetical protein